MKKKRQSEILTIIKEFEVENQDTLQSILRERGFDVTQATISRDINELHLEKSLNENGVNCYCKAHKVNSAQFSTIFQQAVVSIDYAMNTVCVKCHSGLANAACATFDLMNLDYVVGTIAGDDTIFILVRTEKDAKDLTEKLKKML